MDLDRRELHATAQLQEKLSALLDVEVGPRVRPAHEHHAAQGGGGGGSSTAAKQIKAEKAEESRESFIDRSKAEKAEKSREKHRCMAGRGVASSGSPWKLLVPVIQRSMSLKHEPASEPLHISVK